MSQLGLERDLVDHDVYERTVARFRDAGIVLPTFAELAVVRGMVSTGGHPVVVDEDLLHRANDLARLATEIDVDHTGSSGLAGLMQLLGRDAIHPHERVAVLFTGVRR